MTESEFIKHQSCPDCGSSDALAVYTDGHTFCFSCQTRKAGDVQEKTYPCNKCTVQRRGSSPQKKKTQSKNVRKIQNL